MRSDEFLSIINNNLKSVELYKSKPTYKHLNAFFLNVEEIRDIYFIEDGYNVPKDLQEVFKSFNIQFDGVMVGTPEVFMVVVPNGSVTDSIEEAKRKYLLMEGQEPKYVAIKSKDNAEIIAYESALREEFKDFILTQKMDSNIEFLAELNKIKSINKDGICEYIDIKDKFDYLLGLIKNVSYTTGEDVFTVKSFIVEFNKCIDDILDDSRKNRIRKAITYSGEYYSLKDNFIEFSLLSMMFAELYHKADITDIVVIPNMNYSDVLKEYNRYVINEEYILKEVLFYNLMNLPRIYVNTVIDGLILYSISNIQLKYSVIAHSLDNNEATGIGKEMKIQHGSYNVINMYSVFPLDSNDESTYRKANNDLKAVIEKFYKSPFNKREFISVNDLIILEDKNSKEKFICLIEDIDFQANALAVSDGLPAKRVNLDLKTIKNSIPAGFYLNKMLIFDRLRQVKAIDITAIKEELKTNGTSSSIEIIDRLLRGKVIYPNGKTLLKLFTLKNPMSIYNIESPVVQYYLGGINTNNNESSIRNILKTELGLDEARLRVDAFGLFNLMLNFEIRL